MSLLILRAIGGSRERDPDTAPLPASQAQVVAGRTTTDRIYCTKTITQNHSLFPPNPQFYSNTPIHCHTTQTLLPVFYS